MSGPRRRLPRFKDLPLFARLLIPFLTLMVFLGVFGVLLIVRDLSARAQTTLDQDLARRSLEVRSMLRDRELYLVESANFASNVQGIAAAIRARDGLRAAGLMQSVLVLKPDLNLVAAADSTGVGLAEFTRAATGGTPARRSGTRWSSAAFVAQALASGAGDKASGFLAVDGRSMLAIVAPVCSAQPACDPVGVAIVGIDLDTLAAGSLRTAPGEEATRPGQLGVSIYDENERLLASAGQAVGSPKVPAVPAAGAARTTAKVGNTELATAYMPLQVQNRRLGTLAVSVPTAPAFSSVRGTGFRLALIVLVAMVAVVGLGVALSRSILAQVRPLVETNRRLGAGDLSARVPVLAGDELGELARGVNQMAEQLQAIYDTLELRVEQRTEEVRRLLAERTEFFATMSHELRTPLAIIKGQGKMLLAPSFPTGRQARVETGEIVVETSDQLISLVNEILELASAEAGRIDMQIEAVDLGEPLAGLRRTVEGLVTSAGLKLSWDIERDLPAVRADRDRVREIVVNLVDNAVKYSPKGGKVSLSATAQADCVEVSVSDTGVGIPAGTGDLVFEPFYRVKGAKTQRGQASTGLGLALAKRLVEAQGGTIRFSSEPRVRTTFTFTLPLAGSVDGPSPNGAAERSSNPRPTVAAS